MRRTPPASSPSPKTAPHSTRPVGPTQLLSQAILTNRPSVITNARPAPAARIFGPRLEAKSPADGRGGDTRAAARAGRTGSVAGDGAANGAADGGAAGGAA